MQISNSSYLGVEVLARLAAHEMDRPCTSQALAEWTNRSMSSTETLMSRLRAAGLVRATRGPGGGYHLNKPADMITVAEIFKAFDEPHVLSRRPLNAITLELEPLENLHGTDLLWEELKSRILLFLSGVSLTDIAIETVHPFADEPCSFSESQTQIGGHLAVELDPGDREHTLHPAYVHTSLGEEPAVRSGGEHPMQDRAVSPPVQAMSDDDYVKFKNDLGLAPIHRSGSWS